MKTHIRKDMNDLYLFCLERFIYITPPCTHLNIKISKNYIHLIIQVALQRQKRLPLKKAAANLFILTLYYFMDFAIIFE